MMDVKSDRSNTPERSLAGKATPQVTEKAEPNPQPETTNFQFLTFTDFEETTNQQTKKKVRSHVMQRVHQTTRSGGRAQRSRFIVLDTSTLRESLAPQQGQNQILLPSISTLGAGGSNPFANYPIPMNSRAFYLFDHLQGPFCPMFKTMSKIGFFQTITDPAAFRQVLCTSACHIEVLRGAETEPSDAIVLSTQALQSINTRLADPAQNKSDGMIGAILAFCSHNIMFHDQRAALTHFNGLQEIIRLRGGLESLESNPVLRMMLFWADTNIAFTEDTHPRFSLPNDLLFTYIKKPLENEPFAVKLIEACTTEDISNAMRDLSTLNQLLVLQVRSGDDWTDGVFANLNLMPVLYKLLSFRYTHLEQDSGSIRNAAYRAGAILYLAAIRIKFAMNFSAILHIRSLREALSLLESLNVHCELSLLLWLLVVGGTQAITYHEHDWFLSKLAQVIVFMDLKSWDKVMYQLQEVLWVDGLAQEECEVLRVEVSSKLSKSYGHVFV